MHHELAPILPELNPLEHIRDDIRENGFPNRVFESVDALEDHLTQGLALIEADTARVKGLTARERIVGIILNAR